MVPDAGHLLVAPRAAGLTLAFVLGGVALGTASGLLPGLHANNMALVLAVLAPTLPGPPVLVGCAMLAAGVVHTFLDVVPALALGVPDPAMAASALPGHRLVLEGRGGEALRLSAFGSAAAVVVAVPLAVPMTWLMTALYPTIRAHLSLVLGGAALLLVLTERSHRRRVGGALAAATSAALGWVALDYPVAGPFGAGDVLLPLFAGLFGAPVLIDAVGGAGVPPQADPTVTLSRRAVGGLGTVGTVAGAVVGYVPGVSSAIAATLALLAVPGRYGGRGFIVATSGVNTANTVFALFALVALGQPRTGVLVAMDRAGVPLDLPRLLVAVVVAAAAGFALVVTLGDRYLELVGRVDSTRLSVSVLAMLVALSFAFAGGAGVVLFAVSALVGLLPVRLGARRAHLMGVLMGPLALG
ncbi:tripartite tricarboxylate transporter permease [Halomarina ordinaria]|uniref:Tripartite tricarboxylate transporter permease n=1 Tax=Halomarina ordinaria TaxID=3033939 RepID=A0ABD5U9K6_9EURY|nr:tripartite tricarboxylate transporter permease [Halomarina sp. PSRA2]